MKEISRIPPPVQLTLEELMEAAKTRDSDSSVVRVTIPCSSLQEARELYDSMLSYLRSGTVGELSTDRYTPFPERIMFDAELEGRKGHMSMLMGEGIGTMAHMDKFAQMRGITGSDLPGVALEATGEKYSPLALPRMVSYLQERGLEFLAELTPRSLVPCRIAYHTIESLESE